MRFFFIPRYRRESNSDEDYYDENVGNEWTVHVVSWLGCEFMVKVPRRTVRTEAGTFRNTVPARENELFTVGLPTRMCPECAAKFSAEHPVLPEVPLREQLCPVCVAKFS